MTTALMPCCRTVVTKYDADYAHADEAKRRGGVALYCATCTGRIEFRDGEWKSGKVSQP